MLSNETAAKRETDSGLAAVLVAGADFVSEELDLFIRVTMREAGECHLITVVRNSDDEALFQATVYRDGNRLDVASWAPTYWEYDRTSKTFYIAVLPEDLMRSPGR